MVAHLRPDGPGRETRDLNNTNLSGAGRSKAASIAGAACGFSQAPDGRGVVDTAAVHRRPQLLNAAETGAAFDRLIARFPLTGGFYIRMQVGENGRAEPKPASRCSRCHCRRSLS